MKNKVCLVSKFKSYDDSIEEIAMNFASLAGIFSGRKD
jgi:hypothetical protein